MKLRDLRISTQLLVGLGFILAFVALLGVMTWFQADRLWQETQGLYEHPLQTRRAVGELKADVLIIHRGIRDLFLAENEREIQDIMATIDSHEANAYRQIDVLYGCYLGPH